MRYSVGLEYTFLTPKTLTKKQKKEYQYLVGVDVDPEFYFSEKLKQLNFKAYVDGERIVEVPSPIHKDWHSLRSFYTRLNKAKKDLKLLTHSFAYEKKAIIEEPNGGCHVHVGLPKFKNSFEKGLFFKNIARAITARPYIAWVFNQWCDNDNAISPLHQDKEIVDNILEDGLLFSPSYYTPILPFEGDNKDIAISYRPNLKTLEFRMFNIAKDYKDVQNYVKFALAFVEWVDRETKNNILLCNFYDDPKQIQYLSEKGSWGYFLILLNRLGLDPKSYLRYRKNLHDRYLYGKLV